MEFEASSPRSNKNYKIAKVLQKFLEPNFKIKNDVYLNLFLTHLVGKSGDNKNAINKEQSDQFCQWIIEASSLWENSKVSPPSVILSFALNLASQLSTDEQVFVKLNCQNVYESLVGLAQTNLNKDASVTLGLVTLLYSFLEHKSGVQWVLATTYWTDILNLGREAHTMYIRKKAYQFVAKLLEKTICINRNFCCHLVALLIKPLQDTLRSLPRSESLQPAFIENVTLFESLRPSLIFISEVMEILVKGLHSNVLNLFIEFRTADLTKKLLLLSQIEDFSFELIKIRCILLFSKLRKEKPSKPGTVREIAHDSVTLFEIKTMFDVIQGEMDKDHVRCVIRTCQYAHTLYCSLAGGMPLCIRKGEPIEFQNQMVLFQIFPILVFLGEKRGVAIDMMLCDVFQREFIQKLVKMSAIRTLEICLRWKERLMFKPDLIEDMTFGLQYMVKTKKFLNKERAAIFFQPLVYSLKSILTIVEGEGHIDADPSIVTFLHALIETIIDLVKSFDLTWRDSIETISVMSIACDFLKHTLWEQKLVVSGLRLLNLAISKYMSPDMVLLMDNSKTSIVSDTGSLLYAKCHDNSWEIRDTALENVYTLSLNANSKFPSYTNILLEAELPQLVIQMALKDGESYVRATAFRCLHELIQIQEIWEVLLKNDKFLENILNVFENETEGIVRKEVATLIFKIGKFQSFPEAMLPRVYDVMTHAVVGDLHWEVKCNALQFWFNVFESHLNNQGMLDRVFPSVTFSKEHRKIVTLDEAEVRRRIIKVLNQLSHVGCLYVLKQACLDDCDAEVAKKGNKAAGLLFKMLKTYKVSCDDNVDLSEPPSPLGYCAPSPASSTTRTATSPDYTDVLSPEFSTTLFDPVSPYPMPPSPSLNIDLIPSSPPSELFSTPPYPSSQNSSQQTSSRKFSSSTASSSQSGSAIDQDMPLSQQQPSEVNSSNSNFFANHLYSGGNVSSAAQLGVEGSEVPFDSVKAESILDDLLTSSDMSFLQRLYNPSDEVKNTTSEMKKRTYLAPSEYLKFIYNKAETNATEKTQWLDSLVEFDSLLDDILKEYNVVPDVNNMDCY